ncbi:MAG: hypothetical protein Q9170_004751, partial [Blastenia crenularia]
MDTMTITTQLILPQTKGIEQLISHLQREVWTIQDMRHRIIEHEKATVTPPRRKNEGPAFTVIGRKGYAGQRVNLVDLPN